LTTATPDLTIERADPGAAEIAALVDAHIVRSRKYYPVTSCHTYSPQQLHDQGVLLFVGRMDGQAVAIGGLKPLGDGTGEIKSMHTLKAWRGHGIGRRMVDHLITEAQTLGLSAVSLETGSDDASAAARAVYERLGFGFCPPFGDHREDPLSVFMTRPL